MPASYTSRMLVWTLLCAGAVGGLLFCEWREERRGIWWTKPLASAAFLGAALAAGALGSGYGRTLLLGLLLAAAGDVLLIPRDRPAIFRAGVLSFLAGHLAYTAAFFGLGWDLLWLTVAVAAVAAAAWLALAWLAPYLPEDLKAATYAYVLVISLIGVAVGRGRAVAAQRGAAAG